MQTTRGFGDGKVAARAALAVLLCGAAATGQAQSTTGATAEEVIVTGARLEQSLPQELATYGNRLTIVSSVDIEKGGYDDLSQVLQNLVPGLYLSPKNGPFDYVDVSLQGSRTNEILWLVDGVRVSNRLYNSTTPLDTLPSHMIERIEVLEGGQGLFYGTQSVAGVVNVITKGFSDKPGAQFSAGADSNDGTHVDGYFRAGGHGNQFVVFGSSDKADGFQPYPDADYQPSVTNRKRGYDVKTLGVKYAHDFGDAVRLSLGYQNIDGKLDYAYPYAVQKAFNERDEDIFTATLDVTASERVQLYVKAYYHKWDSFWTEYDVDTSTPGVFSLGSDRDFWGYKDQGVNALVKITPGTKLDYYVGYDYQKYGGRDDVLLIAQNDESVNAVFGQIRTTADLWKKGRLAFGVRDNKPSVGQARSVWNLSGQYDFSQQLHVRAAIGTSFRLPDAYELFAIDPFCCVGNPNLKPESSDNLNASIGGLVGSSGKVSWEFVYFRRNVENLIRDVDDGTGSGNTIAENVPGKVRVYGHQAMVRFNPVEDWSASVSYTYNDSRSNLTAGGYDTIPGIPKDQITASLAFEPRAKRVGASVSLNHVGRVYDVVGGGIGQVQRGNYTVADLNGHVYLDSARRHTLSARIENAFDKTYTTRYTRATVDDTDPAVFYAARNLGVPRTFHLRYDYSF
jgi:outer membrane cobalamin receptor